MKKFIFLCVCSLFMVSSCQGKEPSNTQEVVGCVTAGGLIVTDI